MGVTRLSGPLIVSGGIFGAGSSGETPPRNAVFVDTAGVAGDGSNFENPLTSVQDALDNLENSLSDIYVMGDIREEVIAPLGIYGCRIIGAERGRPRHSTSGGVVVAGNGASWREPASGATSGGALLTLREQGWEVHNILFVPKSDATAIRLRRAEDATWPDASHAIINNCRIIPGAVATTIGIEDHGGCSHVGIYNCEFDGLDFAISHITGAGIDAPNRYVIQRCWFRGNDNHIDLPCNLTLVEENVFFTDASGENVAVDAGTSGVNRVLMNWFATAQASITIANGYRPGASDVWRNYSSDTAAMTVGVPT